MQRRKAQFADILQIEITGEIVVGSLGAREFGAASAGSRRS